MLFWIFFQEKSNLYCLLRHHDNIFADKIIILRTMNKKIYFAGFIRGGRDDAALYKRLIDNMKRTDIVLTEHIGKSNISIKSQTKAVDAQIYEQDTEWLRQSDMVIAEYSCPSLGVGYELGFAEAHGIPVYIFYNRNKANL